MESKPEVLKTVHSAIVEGKPQGLALLRVPFEKNQISKLPKPYKKDSPKGKCAECGGWHGLPAVHLDYVGHAALTDRLLDADPSWTWEPVAMGENGQPKLDADGGMWIRLTICGVTRLGYGDAQGKTGGNAVKERIGDALRNAAMRFGAALDLWHKGDLHEAEEERGDERKEKKVDGTTRPAKNVTEFAQRPPNMDVEACERAENAAKKCVDFLLAESVGDAVQEHLSADMDADEYAYFWTFFDSKQRAAMKKYAENAAIKRVTDRAKQPSVENQI